MLHCKVPTPFDFSIFRIIGNELPPRDKLGSRMEVLEFILKNEPRFPNTHRGWFINCIHDIPYREEICALLREHNEYYVVLPMARKKFLAATDRNEQIIESIAINKARNLAFMYGKNIARFVAILDGDCCYDQKTWSGISDFIRRDQTKTNLRYYSTPHIRSSIEEYLRGEVSSLFSEPMPILRNDATLRFDESLPFGEGDKLRFLYHLGHCQEPFKSSELLNEKFCKSIGHVHHLATGDELTESDVKHRVKLRSESIDFLLAKLVSFVPPVRKPNVYWKEIQGWFDFQGLYSHFVFTSPSDSVFVEVGSWLGCSVCYLAQEIKNREKDIRVYAVDTWEGSDEEVHRELIANMHGETLYEKFMYHMNQGDVSDIVTPLRKSSVEAAETFDENSLDVVFIDASHKYEDVLADLRAWYPKVKLGGRIGGHDYLPGHPISDIGVIRAVNEFFECKELELSPAGRTWLHHKK